jgi:agmatinase
MADNPYNNFLGLPPEQSSPENSRAAVIMAGLESTTSFQQGTRLGPQAFVKASQQVELYDIPSGLDFSEVGVWTLPEKSLVGLSNPDALGVIEGQVRDVRRRGLWPITVGGEHTISYAPIRALFDEHPNLSVLQIDAHADLRESYDGSPWSHACVMKRVLDLGIPITGVGIRNYSKDEAQLIPRSKYTVFHDFDLAEQNWEPKKICSKLSTHVYITVDIDGFSPEECPGTGTPEPGGLHWRQVLRLFSHVFAHHEVVGMDINEIMPLSSSARTEFFAAKLAYKMLGMKFFPSDCCRPGVKF